jgi:hypothetical protein
MEYFGRVSDTRIATRARAGRLALAIVALCIAMACSGTTALIRRETVIAL